MVQYNNDNKAGWKKFGKAVIELSNTKVCETVDSNFFEVNGCPESPRHGGDDFRTT